MSIFESWEERQEELAELYFAECTNCDMAYLGDPDCLATGQPFVGQVEFCPMCNPDAFEGPKAFDFDRDN
ncbi:MAG: hypothetical protein GXZ05_08170 [Gammaproteobacteria bacterium]|nr:hypothetical protein [Gammaproteobacteria bacterium]